jgi:acetyl esterase/lipase
MRASGINLWRTVLAAVWIAIAANAVAAHAEEVPIPDQSSAIPLLKANPAAQSEQWERLEGDTQRVQGNDRRIRNVTAPTLMPFLPAPAKATGAAVIVAPGGGFIGLAIDHEGYKVARWLADHGIAAFVLKYRLRETPRDYAAFGAWASKEMKPLLTPPAGSVGAIAKEPQVTIPPEAVEDAKAAVRLVRARANDWQIDPTRIGFLGFSAGAYLALNVALDEDKSVRPDFIAPIYGPLTARAVSSDAPPMFVAMALDDPLMLRAGTRSLDLIESWRAAGRPVEAHLYGAGGHGFGMSSRKQAAAMWIDEFAAWMADRGLLKPAAK